jgi:flavin reductase (DIM6/NTAB) family NADH-FMN oxidoreductase RutF
MAKIIDCETADAREIYKFLISVIAPRPIGWISSISESGVANLAPFSFFNMMSMNPPVFAFSASLFSDLSKKDTLLNIEKTKCFVHNLVTEDLLLPMHRSAEELDSDQSEFAHVGLTPIASHKVLAPRVKEAKVNMECELLQILSLGSKAGNGQVVFGRVIAIHINDESILSAAGDCDADKIAYVSRLGRNNYLLGGRIQSEIRK